MALMEIGAFRHWYDRQIWTTKQNSICTYYRPLLYLHCCCSTKSYLPDICNGHCRTQSIIKVSLRFDKG